MRPAIQIRGIYATAFTRLFLDAGYVIASPSDEILERFGGAGAFDPEREADIELADRDDKQAIGLRGDAGALLTAVERLRSALPDAIVRHAAGHDVMEVELPHGSKSALDEWRHRILPTILRHHRLKIVDSDYVDWIERGDLIGASRSREEVSRRAEKSLVWDAYREGALLRFEHVKPDGRVFSLSEGEIIELDPGGRRLVLERRLTGGGEYDGLEISKEEGDFAESEIVAEDWHCRHSYFRANGEPIGEYYNINTPIELYPTAVRYVDLEVDLVHLPDGKTRIVDEDELERELASGRLTEALGKKAREEAARLEALVRSAS